MGSLSVNCQAGGSAGLITDRVRTQVCDKRLAYLLKTGKIKGSALLHALSTFRPGLKNRVTILKHSVSDCSSGRLDAAVNIILARGYSVQGVSIQRLIRVKHDPCANF